MIYLEEIRKTGLVIVEVTAQGEVLEGRNLGNHHVEKFQRNLAKLFQDKNVALFQDKYLNKNVEKFQNKVANLFLDSNVDQYQGRIVNMFLVNLVKLFLNR